MTVLVADCPLPGLAGDLFTCTLTPAAGPVVTFSHAPSSTKGTPGSTNCGTSSSARKRSGRARALAATTGGDDDDDAALEFTPYDLQRAYDELNGAATLL
jgi:hypothetical protein